MTTNSNLGLGIQRNVLSRKALYNLRAPGVFAKWPLIGLMLFLLGGLTFGALAYQLGTNGPVIQWDMTATKALHAAAQNIPASLVEYILFGFFLGKEMILMIGTILAIYFLYKHFWREMAMVLIGLGGGGLIWYFLSQYFDRPRPDTQIKVLLLRDPSFPSGAALAAVLCYGLLAYLLVPKMPSRFWKWAVVVLLTLLTAFIGFSSLLLGAHYVTDVIAGYALGLAWAGLVYTLMEKFFTEGTMRNQESLSKSPPLEGLRAPGLFRRWPILGLIMILLGGLSFGALGYNLLTHGPLVQLDITTYKELLATARAAPPSVNEIMLFGFFIGKQVVQVIVTILTLYFLYQRFWPELGMLWISSAAGSVVWNFIIAYFARPRPPEQTGLVITTIPSFPSGHAMSALICYGFLAYLLVPKMPSRFWKWTVSIAAALIILFDGFSRVFQGGHYLTDVLAGYALGIAWAGLVYTIIEGIFMKRKIENVEKR
ncbi:MAG TPA: phosphatase PAP2 family protein [Anaerolineales bacterium]|nr:phosphatase PAP2 family protein [Anaerolineales bacterium]